MQWWMTAAVLLAVSPSQGAFCVVPMDATWQDARGDVDEHDLLRFGMGPLSDDPDDGTGMHLLFADRVRDPRIGHREDLVYHAYVWRAIPGDRAEVFLDCIRIDDEVRRGAAWIDPGLAAIPHQACPGLESVGATARVDDREVHVEMAPDVYAAAAATPYCAAMQVIIETPEGGLVESTPTLPTQAVAEGSGCPPGSVLQDGERECHGKRSPGVSVPVLAGVLVAALWLARRR